jgi:hypothetical protein
MLRAIIQDARQKKIVLKVCPQMVSGKVKRWIVLQAFGVHPSPQVHAHGRCEGFPKARKDALCALPQLRGRTRVLVLVQFAKDDRRKNDKDVLRLHESEPVNLLQALVVQQDVRVYEEDYVTHGVLRCSRHHRFQR